MERKIIKKWFWVWEFEKEEQWLNTMAQSGWVLDKLGLCKYEFVSCVPGEYTVRLEMRDHDQEYIDFMAETGAEYVGRMAKWIYFRKKAADGPFDIFSDIDSRITHLDKIGKMLGISKERARQILHQAMEKLQKMGASLGLEDFLHE